MIYLIGSFMVNDNYGDVLQADFWVKWYHKLGINIKYICFKEGIERCLRSLQLEKDELMTVDNFIKLKRVSQVNFVHFYGGGYMNERWGQVFADIAKHAVGLGMKVFATGVQVDKEFIEMTTSLQINYLSVRDRISQEITGSNALIIDDSFGYFYENRFRYDIFWLLDFFYQKKNGVLLQLSLNDYVHDNIDREHILNIFKSFILNLKTYYKITLCSSFPKDIDGIVENERLVQLFGLNVDDFDFLTTRELDQSNMHDYVFAIANSFHTYMMLINKYNCPVFFLSFNDYYAQKSIALKDYNMLLENRLITDPQKLNKLDIFNMNKRGLNRLKIIMKEKDILLITSMVKNLVTK